MVQWWPTAFPSQPYNTWFKASRPGETAHDPCEWPTGLYWFYKVPASGGHKAQLVFYSEVDKYYKACWADPGIVEFKAGVKYLLCYIGDTPNWAGCNLVAVAPPCSNWRSDFYEEPAVTRSQSSALNAAVQSNRELSVGITASVIKTGNLIDGITASVQGFRQQPIILRAGVRGEITRDVLINAAIAKQRDLAPGIEAAVAKDSDLPINIQATVCGNPQINIRTRAAVRGESQKSSGIIAYVVVSRGPQIYLEMENLVPQEFDLRSTPNWSSKIKDWRKDTLGK